MKPVWLETWTAEDAEQEPQEFYMRFARIITGGEAMLVDAQNETAAARVRLAAAAPAMVRLTLALEWSGWQDWVGDEGRWAGPSCNGRLVSDDPYEKDRDQEELAEHPEWFGHRAGCKLDATLNAAGFPDQASRDAAREMIRKAGGT